MKISIFCRHCCRNDERARDLLDYNSHQWIDDDNGKSAFYIGDANWHTGRNVYFAAGITGNTHAGRSHLLRYLDEIGFDCEEVAR